MAEKKSGGKKNNTAAKRIDWDSVEPLYRAGQLSNYEISRQYARDHVHSQVWRTTVTEAAIRKQAKLKKWQKNIADRVRLLAEERLVRETVRTDSDSSEITESELIERAAAKPVEIRLGQRRRVIDLMEVGELLRAQIRAAFESGKGRLDKSEFASTTTAYRQLVQAMNQLHDMECNSFGLDKGDGSGPVRIVITRKGLEEEAD
jgi:L-rhamnose mutarotase